jgi:hypothetical protein
MELGRMIRKPLVPAAFAVFLCASLQATAQNDITVSTRALELQALAEQLRERDQRDRAQVAEYARRLGIPARRELPGDRVLELQRIVPGKGPLFYITNNLDAADTVSTDEVWPGGSVGLDLDGGGMTVGAWDGGAVFAAHPDFAGRLTQVDGAIAVSNHSTHVAGTLVGAGAWLLPEARGMAFAAQLEAYDWTSDTAEMALAAAGGLLVSNHSYGIAAGWIYIGGAPPDNWWWIGGDQPSDVEDPNFGYYDAETRLWDQIAYDAPYYLVVKAAGNDRTDIGPSPGEEYTVIDQDGSFLFTSTLPREPDCAPAGYDCLPTNSVAKNVLTVGAVDDVPGGYSPLAGPSSVQMADFSSWGPTDDGRIKPDLVGNGMFLMSTWGDSPYYAAAAGTSMAAPNVTGSLILLQEHYQDLHGPGRFMRSATLKALAIHTADEAGDADGPDYAFGWGLLNTAAAAEVISGDGGDHQIIEGSLANGATDSVVINVTEADVSITATLVWMDPPGTPVAPALDPPDLMLVNDLDLRVIDGTTTYLPWVLDPAVPAAAATTGDNFRDNVEQVEAMGVGSGSYTVQVSHKGTLLDGETQDYALVISVAPAPLTGSGLLLDEDFSGGLSPGWSVDTLWGVPWTINAPVSGDPRLDNGTGGAGQFAMVDNGYVNQTLTSLRTPLLDLSANSAAVLRFSSYYNYDTFESLNVDASTDGGAGWFNVWQFQGFNPLPTRYVLDLSTAIAGQSGAMLRFRFDSEGFISGDFWQLDDIELEVFGGPPSGDPPGQASSPVPADGATNVATDADLAWTAGASAASHDVYFGTDATPDAGEFQQNQAGTAFDPGPLATSTTYYWRVDEVNPNGTTAGPVWSFTTESAASTAIHLADLQGIPEPARRGRWNAMVIVTVVDAAGVPVAGVQADGDWSNGATGAGSCVVPTDANGECLVEKQNLKSNVASVDFTVTNLVAAGFTYDGDANEVAPAVTVFREDPDQQPNAVDDGFSTPTGTVLNGNVLANDDPGDAPATVTAFDDTSASGFSVNVAPNGDFTYTPAGSFEGDDSFGYTITDVDGDVSSATVSITVGSPPVTRSVAASTDKVQGNKVVTVTWADFQNDNVTISRNGILQATVSNAVGSWQDNLGKKPAGGFSYEVCEASPGPTTGCKSAAVSF